MKAFTISIIKYPHSNTTQTGIMATCVEEAVKLIIVKHNLSNKDRVIAIEISDYVPVDTTGISFTEIGEGYYQVDKEPPESLTFETELGTLTVPIPAGVQSKVLGRAKREEGLYRKPVPEDIDITYLSSLPLDKMKAKIVELLGVAELPVKHEMDLVQIDAFYARMDKEANDMEEKYGQDNPLAFASRTAANITFELIGSTIRMIFLEHNTK